MRNLNLLGPLKLFKRRRNLSHPFYFRRNLFKGLQLNWCITLESCHTNWCSARRYWSSCALHGELPLVLLAALICPLFGLGSCSHSLGSGGHTRRESTSFSHCGGHYDWHAFLRHSFMHRRNGWRHGGGTADLIGLAHPPFRLSVFVARPPPLQWSWWSVCNEEV